MSIIDARFVQYLNAHLNKDEWYHFDNEIQNTLVDVEPVRDKLEHFLEAVNNELHKVFNYKYLTIEKLLKLSLELY